MMTHNAAPAKRRWTCFTVPVPVIVFLSLVETVSVLLGLHNRFPTGYNNEDNSSLGNRFENAVKVDGSEENDKKEDDRRINGLVDKFKPNLPQVVILNDPCKVDGDFPIDHSNPTTRTGPSILQTKDATSGAIPGDMNSKGPPRSHGFSSTIVGEKLKESHHF